MAYETLRLAHDACEPMRADLGAGASDYRLEDDFLASVEEFLVRVAKHPRQYLESWNLEDEIDNRGFAIAVGGILAHVRRTMATPVRERGKPPFAK